MSGDRFITNAQRSLRVCHLFESEVLTWLLLKQWNHPFSEDSDFRSALLETATEVLQAASGNPHQVFIDGLPSGDMNLIAAIWYAEHCTVANQMTFEADEDPEGRRRWLAAIRHIFPSCFCSQNDLGPD